MNYFFNISTFFLQYYILSVLIKLKDKLRIMRNNYDMPMYHRTNLLYTPCSCAYSSCQQRFKPHSSFIKSLKLYSNICILYRSINLNVTLKLLNIIFVYVSQSFCCDNGMAMTGKRGSIRKSTTKALAEAREPAPEPASRSTAVVLPNQHHKNNQKLPLYYFTNTSTTFQLAQNFTNSRYLLRSLDPSAPFFLRLAAPKHKTARRTRAKNKQKGLQIAIASVRVATRE